MQIHIHIHHHQIDEKKIDKLLELAIVNNQNQRQIMTDLTEITQEVTESTDAQQSAAILLQDLKARLDAAGTDPVALKALSDALSSSTDALAAAIVANTPAA